MVTASTTLEQEEEIARDIAVRAETLSEVWRRMETNSAKAQGRQREDYAKRRTFSNPPDWEFRVGDFVQLKPPMRQGVLGSLTKGLYNTVYPLYATHGTMLILLAKEKGGGFTFKEWPKEQARIVHRGRGTMPEKILRQCGMMEMIPMEALLGGTYEVEKYDPAAPDGVEADEAVEDAAEEGDGVGAGDARADRDVIGEPAGVREDALDGSQQDTEAVDRKGKKQALDDEQTLDIEAWRRYLVSGEGTSAQGAEAARATAEAVKAIAEAARAVAEAAHETAKHNSIKVVADGQTAKEDGDEGGEQEAFGTVVYDDPPVVYTRKRGTKKDSAEPGEGQPKRQRKIVVARRSKPV